MNVGNPTKSLDALQMKRFTLLQRHSLLVPALTAVLTFTINCTRRNPPQIDSSAYPLAVDVKKVGSYPALTKSGAGYFYDNVLEYRVWIKPAEGGDDYHKAFARYEDALAFSKETTEPR